MTLPPVGSVLDVELASGSNRYARLTETGLVDVEGKPLGRIEDCASWRHVNDQERADWEAEMLTQGLADVALTRGAVALSLLLAEAFDDPRVRDDELCHVVNLLRDRRLDAKASQCAAMRFVDPPVRRKTIVGVAPPAPMSAPTPTKAPVLGGYSFVSTDRRAP